MSSVLTRIRNYGLGALHRPREESGSNPQRQTRERFLAWARTLYDHESWMKKDAENWVNDTFTFNPDGTVTVEGKLYLFGKKIDGLPEGITEVKKGVNLANSTFTRLDTLPRKIGGDLELTNTPATSLDTLPQGLEIDGGLYLYNMQKLGSLEGLKRVAKIGKDLYASAIPARNIPEGVPVAGKVWVLNSQKDLAEDAQKKGYATYLYG